MASRRRSDYDPSLVEAAKLIQTRTPGKTAKPRPWDYEGQTLADWFNERRVADTATYDTRDSGGVQPLPGNYEIRDDRVQRDEPNFLLRNPWIIPALGAGGGAGLQALLGTGALAGAGGGGGSAAASSLPAHLGGEVAGGTAAGGAGSWLSQHWLDLAKAGVAGAGTVGAAANARDQPEIPPELLELLRMQMSRMQSQEPLYQAVLKLAQSRMPRG